MPNKALIVFPGRISLIKGMYGTRGLAGGMLRTVTLPKPIASLPGGSALAGSLSRIRRVLAVPGICAIGLAVALAAPVAAQDVAPGTTEAPAASGGSSPLRIPYAPVARLIAPANPAPDSAFGTSTENIIPTPQVEPAPGAGAMNAPTPPQGSLPGLTLLAPAAVPAREIQPLVVVELFTSQGCASCLPADQLLGDLAGRTDVLPLSYHVDYWDYLGWADEFANPAFTRRQRGYAKGAGQRAVYTPQFIIDGIDTPSHQRPADLTAVIRAHAATPAPLAMDRVSEAGRDVLTLTPRTKLPPQIAVLLVRYLPERRIDIESGENRGVSMMYRNIVAGTEMLAQWDGKAPLRLVVTPGQGEQDSFPPDTRHAILVQEIKPGAVATPGHILTSIRLD